MNQSKWRKLLPELVFALNTSESKAIKCVPYKVVFARDPVLPIDVRFDVGEKSQQLDVISAKEFSDERQSVIQDMYDAVISQLKLSKEAMMKQYNKKVKFNNYAEGDKVWLKVKYYKTGENRKLAPRRGGPWIVVRKLPNGVNFEIRNVATKEVKIVHHDRLTPVRENDIHTPIQPRRRNVTLQLPADDDSESETDSDDGTFQGDASQSDYEPTSGDESSADSEVNEEERRYPARERVQREIPGAVPWSAVPRI